MFWVWSEWNLMEIALNLEIDDARQLKTFLLRN